MKITEVKLCVLEDPERHVGGGHELVTVPGLRRIQYTHRGRSDGERRPERQAFLEVHTAW